VISNNRICEPEADAIERTRRLERPHHETRCVRNPESSWISLDR
jgi:hypothetical protein